MDAVIIYPQQNYNCTILELVRISFTVDKNNELKQKYRLFDEQSGYSMNSHVVRWTVRLFDEQSCYSMNSQIIRWTVMLFDEQSCCSMNSHVIRWTVMLFDEQSVIRWTVSYSMNSQLFDEQFGVIKKLYGYLVSQKLNELNEAIRQHREKKANQY